MGKKQAHSKIFSGNAWWVTVVYLLQFVILHYRDNDGSLSEKCRQARRVLNRPLLYRIAAQHLTSLFLFFSPSSTVRRHPHSSRFDRVLSLTSIPLPTVTDLQWRERWTNNTILKRPEVWITMGEQRRQKCLQEKLSLLQMKRFLCAFYFSWIVSFLFLLLLFVCFRFNVTPSKELRTPWL